LKVTSHNAFGECFQPAMNRIVFLLSLLLGLFSCCSAQPPALSGAWIPVKLHWAPSEDFEEICMVAEAKVLYFLADGAFAIINGTISQEGQETLNVTAGWQTVFTGHWSRAGKRVTVTYELSWAWVKPIGGPKEEYQDVLSMTEKGTLLYGGVEYRREPRLDRNSLQHITVLVPAFAGGQNTE
jgi:hypothetical protein